MDHTLSEIGTDAAQNKLSSSVDVTFNATGPGVITVTISDATPPADLPNGISDRAESILFTVYAVQQQSAVQNQTVTFTSGDGVEYGNDDDDPQLNTYFTFGTVTDSPVHYSVEGSGRVYVQSPTTRKRGSIRVRLPALCGRVVTPVYFLT